jgi:hypothetical protein
MNISIQTTEWYDYTLTEEEEKIVRECAESQQISLVDAIWWCHYHNKVDVFDKAKRYDIDMKEIAIHNEYGRIVERG